MALIVPVLIFAPWIVVEPLVLKALKVTSPVNARPIKALLIVKFPPVPVVSPVGVPLPSFPSIAETVAYQ